MASKGADFTSTASAKPYPFIIIVAIVLICIASFFIYSNINQNNSSNKSSTSQKNQNTGSPGAYLNSDGKNGWEIYESKEYSFQTKYPSGWFVKSYSSLPNRILFDEEPLPSNQQSETEVVSTEIEIFVSEEKNIQEEIEKLKSAHQFMNFSQKELELGGAVGVVIEGTVTGESYIEGSYYKRVFINKGSRTYSLIFASLSKKNLEIFNSMIAVFRFL